MLENWLRSLNQLLRAFGQLVAVSPFFLHLKRRPSRMHLSRSVWSNFLLGNICILYTPFNSFDSNFNRCRSTITSSWIAVWLLCTLYTTTWWPSTPAGRLNSFHIFYEIGQLRTFFPNRDLFGIRHATSPKRYLGMPVPPYSSASTNSVDGPVAETLSYLN